MEAFNETLCWEMRKLNLEIIPQGSLHHLSVETTLKDNIILAQQRDKGVRTIKQKLAQGEEKYKCFQVDPEGVLRTITFINRYWTRPTCPNSPCTLAVPRCTRI
jgi:hypothetical protein